MRGTAIAGVIAVVGLAAAAPATPTTWADWVGDYRAALVWKACSTPGARTATIAVDAIDGAMQIDLTGAGGGLPVLSLVEDGAAWTAKQGDLAVRIKRPRANQLVVDVVLDSGCVVRGTLTRSSTKHADCDRLIAWARIEQRCTKRTDPPLEDPAVLATTRWKTKAITRSCAARAAKLETSLVDAGCAVSPDPLASTSSPQCQRMRATAAKLARCTTLDPPSARVVQRAQALPTTADDEHLRAQLEIECRWTYDALIQIAANQRCPL